MLWDTLNGNQHIAPLAGSLLRLVESQEEIATLSLVDTLDEQALLEEMLEATKPRFPDNTDDLHYLLATPFRYPPLLWGSRFGQTHQPSLFYGGCDTASTLAESAYYRLVFLASIDGPHPKPAIRSEHTLFAVTYGVQRGIDLRQPPFSQHEAMLAHPTDYTVSQQLGTDMRDDGVGAFLYRSARAATGTCGALYAPTAFTTKTPLNAQQWLCEVSAEGVIFKGSGSQRNILHRFPAASFTVNGVLPMPA